MKILWYVNIILPKAAQAFNLKAQTGGGWLIGQADMLAGSGVELYIANVTPLVSSVTQRKVDNIQYILVPAKGNNYDAYFKELLSEISPDIVHVFGTEYIYNTYLVSLCRLLGKKCVVSIQGLMSQYAKHYCDGLPEKYNKISLPRLIMTKLYYADSIALGQKNFEKQGALETNAIRETKNVIGRTHWDKKHTKLISPGVTYFHVNENLRDEFYKGERWQYEACQKHSAFISQAFYPIKGFHQLLKAMPQLIARYPDLHIYVGGQKAYSLSNKLLDVVVDYFFEYQSYIKKLIKENKLEKYITFTGSLNETQMKEQFLNANVFVSPSTIENSPNSVGEAMILGVPIVASNVGGVSTMLTDNKDGLLYKFDETDNMVKHICEIFDKPESAKAYGENAHKHAKITHDKVINTAALVQVYNAIITQGG